MKERSITGSRSPTLRSYLGATSSTNDIVASTIYVSRSKPRATKTHANVQSPDGFSNDKNPEICELRQELAVLQIFSRIRECFESVPNFFWNFYIEALLVPAYRHEWKRYQRWDPLVRVMTKREVDKKRHWKRLDARKKQNFNEKYHFNTEEYKGHPHDHENCTRARFNVSGRIFETQLRSLNHYPKTLLGSPVRRLPFYDPIEQCYFFDRNRESFEMILYYYQSGGRIRRPVDIDASVFYRELIFFDLGDNILTEFRESEGYYADDEEVKILPKNVFQRKLWLLLEYPESSTLATIVALTSVFTIILSIASFCIATVPDFKGASVPINGSYPGLIPEEDDADDMADLFNVIETICVIWFALELVTRLLSSPKKSRFCLDLMNVIDFVSIVPYFVQLTTTLSQSNTSESESINKTTSFSVLRVIRLVRVFRIFKLSRHSKGLQILGLTLKASLRELGLLIFFLFIGVVLFSSAVYFAEQGNASKSLYPSIPSAFYWGVVTMTTVGYGDMVPRTVMGKLIGTVTAVAGVLTIALPVPVIVSNFNFFYARSQDKKGMDDDVYGEEHVRMCPFLPGNGIHPDAPEGYDGTLPSAGAFDDSTSEQRLELDEKKQLKKEKESWWRMEK